MAELPVGRGIGHGGAALLMPPLWLRVFPAAWWAFADWSARFPVGYGLTGCGGRRPGTRGSGSGEEYSGRSRRWRCPWEVLVPPPLFSSVEPSLSASTEPCKHDQRPDGSSPPTTRKRVVLLPHAQIEPSDTGPTSAAPEEPHA